MQHNKYLYETDKAHVEMDSGHRGCDIHAVDDFM